MLEMKNVVKIYRTDLIETHALRDFNLRVAEGEFVAVTGPSGSGKTTFLNVAGLLESFDSGSYRLDGQDVGMLDDDARARTRNRHIGFIFQSFNLIPDLDVFDNIDVPLRYRGLPAPERRRRIDGVLETVGLGARAHHLPAEANKARCSQSCVCRCYAAPRLYPPLICSRPYIGPLNTLTL